MTRKKTHDEFIKDVYGQVGDEYVVLGTYINSRTKIKIRHNCDLCNNYEYEVNPNMFLQGSRCGKCARIKDKFNIKDIYKILNDKYGDVYEILGEVDGIKTKTLVKHKPCGYEWEVKISDLFRRERCPHCNKRVMNKTKEYFQKELNDIYGENIYTVLTEYKTNREKVLVRHEECGTEFYCSPNDMISDKRQQCPVCSKIHYLNLIRKPHDVFIQELKEIHGGEYEVLTPYITAHTKIKVRHIDCDCIYETTPNSLLKGNECPMCHKPSKGERKISQVLNDNNIKYTIQYKPKGCKSKKQLSYDFYLKDFNICIEYNGIQHYKPIEVFGGEKSFNVQKKNDNIKKDYCLNSKIDLLVIPYWEFDNIEDILLEKLNINKDLEVAN